MRGLVITTRNEAYVAEFRDFFGISDAMGWRMTEHVNAWGLAAPYCILIDEEGRIKEEAPKINWIASFWYGANVHGQPICGDIVIMKDIMTNDGPDIGGLTEDEARNLVDMIRHVWPVEVKEFKKFD